MKNLSLQSFVKKNCYSSIKEARKHLQRYKQRGILFIQEDIPHLHSTAEFELYYALARNFMYQNAFPMTRKLYELYPEPSHKLLQTMYALYYGERPPKPMYLLNLNVYVGEEFVWFYET